MLRRILCLMGGVGLVAGLSAVLAADSQPLPAPRGQAVVRGISGTCGNAPDYLGTASCSSSSCHHQNGHQRVVGSEFVTWNSEDPHRKAWDTLFSPRSERMVRNLHGPTAAPASQTAWCLACHATGEGNLAKAAPEFTLVDAVGCESCHGPAKTWLSAHTKAGFRELDPATKEREHGLWNTKDLAGRARVCANCHVGNADVPLMQVNHDLIAAGHPRLNFEFSSALAKYPAHWRVDGQNARVPDSGWRAWQVGQVAVAEAVARLTASRAEQSVRGGTWPEFAEQDCFSCHKDLTVENARAPSRTPLSVGRAAWQTWYAGSMTWADEEAEAALAPLRRHMSQSAPDARKAGALAKAASGILARRARALVEGASLSTQGEGELLARLARETGREAGRLEWEQQAQRYLAMVALREDIRRRAGRFDAAFEKPYLDLRDALIGQFPPGHDSPRADSDESKAARDRGMVLRKMESALGGIAESTR